MAVAAAADENAIDVAENDKAAAAAAGRETGEKRKRVDQSDRTERRKSQIAAVAETVDQTESSSWLGVVEGEPLTPRNHRAADLGWTSPSSCWSSRRFSDRCRRSGACKRVESGRKGVLGRRKGTE